MTPERITIVLTVLAAVVVVLTRVRLSRDGGEAAGRLSIPKGLLNAHTFAGIPAVVVWAYYLYKGNSLAGLVALVLWWITAIAGLLILARWIPARGRHSSSAVSDTWGEGPGLSILAHIGVLVGVLIFTALFLLGKI